ncbi:MAG: hypothetical protein KDK45_23735, partial [Leptospiraceae bacterium]|nr:hypothetical protein [Leptospiraceae bacterium]
LTSENRWEAGLQLKLDEVEGELKKVGFFALELLQKDGSRVRIPYRLLLEKQFVVRSGRKEELRGHTFELICEKGTRYSSIERKIMEIIYNYPWTSLAREPIIKNISRPGGELELEITVYTLGNTNYNELEKKIISGITRDPKKEGNR